MGEKLFLPNTDPPLTGQTLHFESLNSQVVMYRFKGRKTLNILTDQKGKKKFEELIMTANEAIFKKKKKLNIAFIDFNHKSVQPHDTGVCASPH